MHQRGRWTHYVGGWGRLKVLFACSTLDGKLNIPDYSAVTEKRVLRFEEVLDMFNAQLPPPKDSVLPGTPDPARLQALIGRCAMGDQAAFAELYQITSAKLFAVAARILRRDDQAEEALQDSFVNIWNHCATYRSDLAAPMTWMTSIVRNRALDLKRRPALEVTGEHSDLWVEAFADDAPGPFEQMQDASAARRLHHCLGRIDAQQRQTIALAFIHGLTHSELAHHLKVPLGSIKTWIRRGLIKLKDCLGGPVEVDGH